MWLLSCLCLSFTAAACLVLIFWRAYDNNLTQLVGMGILTFGCAARAKDIWFTQLVANDWFLVHGGMALVAAGTLARVYVESRAARDPWPELESQ